MHHTRMPSLDDIPTLPTATLSADDMIAVIDGSDRRSPRRATLAALKTFTLSGNLGAIQATSVNTPAISNVGQFSINDATFPLEDPQSPGQVYVDDNGFLKVSGQ